MWLSVGCFLLQECTSNKYVTEFLCSATLHECQMKPMPRRSYQLHDWRTGGDHRDTVVLRGWRLSIKTWNAITSPWMKQFTWLRIIHSGDWCLRLVQCTSSGACQKRMNVWQRATVIVDRADKYSWSISTCTSQLTCLVSTDNTPRDNDQRTLNSTTFIWHQKLSWQYQQFTCSVEATSRAPWAAYRWRDYCRHGIEELQNALSEQTATTFCAN